MLEIQQKSLDFVITGISLFSKNVWQLLNVTFKNRIYHIFINFFILLDTT
jgi:hypothetical protein